MWYTNMFSTLIVYQKYLVKSMKEGCAMRSLYASSGPKAEGVPTNNQRDGVRTLSPLMRLRQGTSYSPNRLFSQSTTVSDHYNVFLACIQLFHGYAGNSQIIVPRQWRRSGKLLPEAGGRWQQFSRSSPLPRDNGSTVPQVALKYMFYLRNKSSALLPSNLPSVIDRSNLSPSREAAR